MLKTHQIFWICNICGMIAQKKRIIGGKLYNGITLFMKLLKHLLSCSLFCLLDYLYFLHPYLKKKEGLNNIKVHNSSNIHVPAMIMTNVLSDKIRKNPVPYHCKLYFSNGFNNY